MRTVVALLSTCLLLFGSANAQLPKSAKDRHEYDLVDVRWDISFDFAKGRISGDVTNTVIPTRDTQELYFDCGKLNVVSVRIDGVPALSSSNRDVLEIRSASSLHKGKKVAVEILYSGEPEAGIYFVPAARAFPAHTDIVYTQGEMEDNRYWLPTYDDPDDKATSEGTIHVPAGWKALSNGRLVEVRHEGATDAWHWKMDQPHSTYLISFVAGPYDEVVDGTVPVPVSYWVPQGLEEWGAAAFGRTDKIVQFYGKLTGIPYVWPKYSQSAVADFMFGGMENVTCTTQTINALHPWSVAPNVDSTGLVAHELAHQWFGDLITTRDWSHIWLNEGWATFLPPFWDRERSGASAFDVDRYEIFQGALGAHAAAPDRPVVWTHYELPIDMFDGFAYPGGASRMFMLMHQVGEARFWPAITRYLNEYKFKNVTTEEFFESLSKSLGVDLDLFRKQWFYTPAAPSLTVRREGDTTYIAQGSTAFHLPLEYWLLDPSGNIEKRRLDLPADARTEIPDVRGRLVILDPEVWLMANISYDMGYGPLEWRRIYDAAPNAAAKFRIIDSEFSTLSDDMKDSIARNERTPAVLEHMIAQILNSSFLLDMSRSPDAKIEAAAISAMAGAPKSPACTARLREIWSTSKNDVLREDALRSLLALTQDGGLADSAFQMDSYDDGIRTAVLTYWADKDPDKARSTALSVLRGAGSEPLKLASMRTLGHVKDRPGEHEAYDILVGFLSERSNSPLRTAIGALAEYGNKAAIPLIQERANHSLHFVRRDVQSALQRLRNQ